MQNPCEVAPIVLMLVVFSPTAWLLSRFIFDVIPLRVIPTTIVSYLHSFSTPSYHCLVLEHVGGGELFDLIDSAESHAQLDEILLRRMFGELCKAVGWMHGVGLIHRDIKLESKDDLFSLYPYLIEYMKLTLVPG